MKNKVSAIIMASGLSKRMNQNKLKMKINSKCIYEFILDTLLECNNLFNEIIVVANDDEVIEKAKKYKFKYVKNELYHIGQSASIKLGIENSSNPKGYMFFTADQPFISKNTVIKLLMCFDEFQDKIIIPQYNKVNGSPVVFSASFKNELLKLENDMGGKYVIKENQDKIVNVQINSDKEKIDIDTLEDYNEACKKEGVLNEK